MDPLDRLYWRLVETLRRERPGSAWELTIAEIYQHLVPYRATRVDLGFAELPEYEHALLRLLAGERGYVSLNVPQVQEELAKELRAPNPILGLYRDYAAVGVHLNPAPSPSEATLPDGPPPAPEPRPAPQAPAAQPAPSPPAAPSAAAVPVVEVFPQPPRRPSLCRSCHSPLPEDREVRFCPFCGATQRALPCRACGEMVEPEWKFCVGCGTGQGQAG